MYVFGGSQKIKEPETNEPIFGIPEVDSQFKKYYFMIGDDSVLVRCANITVTRVVKRTVWYKEAMADGFRERYRFVKEGSDFDGEVVSSPMGLSVITSKGAVYARKQVAAYLDERVEMHLAELAKAEKRRDMVKEAIRLMEPVLEEEQDEQN